MCVQKLFKERFSKYKGWRDLLYSKLTILLFTLAYSFILVIGLCIIDFRSFINENHTKPNRTLGSHFPTLKYDYILVFHPDRMEYIAVNALDTKHVIVPGDLAPNPQLDPDLFAFLPLEQYRLKHYPKTAIPAGQLVLLSNLVDIPDPSPVTKTGAPPPTDTTLHN